MFGQETSAFKQNFLKDGLVIACLEVSYRWDRLGEQYIWKKKHTTAQKDGLPKCFSDISENLHMIAL